MIIKKLWEVFGKNPHGKVKYAYNLLTWKITT